MTSFGAFLVGVANRDVTNLINGSIGATLMAFILVQTARALGVADADLAEERRRYPAGSAPRRPLSSYPSVILRATSGSPPRAMWLRAVVAWLLVVGVTGTFYLVVTRDPQLLIFPQAIVLFTLLLVALVGKFTAADDQAR